MIPSQVIIQPILLNAISRESAAACLTPAELERAHRFRFAHDSTRWMSCRAQLRMTLSNLLDLAPDMIPIITSEFGKPLLAPPHADLHFNLTHSRDLGLIAFSCDGPVGIDLEENLRRADLLGCESTFCHPEEILGLPNDTELRGTQLLKIWTHKEAVLKAIGTGLSHPPEHVRIQFDLPVCRAFSDHPLPGIEHQRLLNLHHPMLDTYQAVVSMPISVTTVNFNEPGRPTSP